MCGVFNSSSKSSERTQHPLLSATSPTMPRSAASTSACPDIPEGVDLPPEYVAKQCRRCGVWSVAHARYDQSKGKEAAWGILVAWGRGCMTNPVGCHCLTCKKAWICPHVCQLFCTIYHVPSTCTMYHTMCTKIVYHAPYHMYQKSVPKLM